MGERQVTSGDETFSFDALPGWRLAVREMTLRAGMLVTAYDEDADEDGNPDWLLATGVVEPSRDWMQCRDSKWVLRFDENGCLHESDLKNA